MTDIKEREQHFATLKSKYQVSDYEDSSSSSHLYKVLKQLDSGKPLSESDINFLKKRKLTNILALAVDKDAASLIFDQKKHFASLKSKYGVSDYQDKSPSNPLYAILQKLDKGKRLDPIDVAWLEEHHINSWEERKLFSGKILRAYHRLEAIFYEQQYKRTGNKWNLSNGSSHWRGAKQPERALTLTENLNFDKIKENKLKSALLTTRGGAFRDIHELDQAEQCARKAIKYQPSSHHPYTLMGALCYERREYHEGDHWFNEAIKRGASPRDQDAEIKRVIKNADKDKRREVAEHLLKKDPVRYKWAKKYIVDKRS
ncbi:hypothetical protein THIOM_003815 [Candidatus Thiomargarita nelsonii]|uniref:Uncharacterized protein n=1 Tax=Candidatus Thiomargarita nelsonii TaxID=1003181 RepID=A0A176RXQ2_9GAMM|nr:hypothetical protein THIOM_003815 [Candidatus Thiomargarita nelsonii]